MKTAILQDSELMIDLSDLDIEEIEVLVQEGSRGMPEFAASSGTTVSCGTVQCCNCSSVVS